MLLGSIVNARTEISHSIRFAASVVMGSCDQSLSELRQYKTPMDAVSRGCNLEDQAARSYLANIGLAFHIQDRPIENLSGGQKSRLMMLRLRLLKPNFFVLDEPTNHLDIDGQEQLENELICSGATSIVVSHDRAFLRNLGTRFWQIKGKRLVEVESPESFIAEQLDVEVARFV